MLLITDGLRSYGVAWRDLPPEARHRTGRCLNNRAENLYGAFQVKCFPAAFPAF